MRVIDWNGGGDRTGVTDMRAVHAQRGILPGARAVDRIVGTCHFCDGALGDGESLEHRACAGEFYRRRAARMCVRCGEQESGRVRQFGSDSCSECREAECAPYRGYPPGTSAP